MDILEIKRKGSYYNDIVVPFDGAKVPAVNDPDWSPFVGNLNAYTFAVNDLLEFSSEILHGYQEGTDLQLHVHWVTNGTNVDIRYVKWEVERTITNMGGAGVGGVFPSTSLNSAELAIPANTPSLTHMYSDLGTISGTGIKIGAMIKGRVRRITSAGTAPTNNPFGLAVGIHYRVNLLGSRLITQK